MIRLNDRSDSQYIHQYPDLEVVSFRGFQLLWFVRENMGGRWVTACLSESILGHFVVHPVIQGMNA